MIIWFIDYAVKMSAPEPPNPFEPVPEDRPEDWREDPDED